MPNFRVYVGKEAKVSVLKGNCGRAALPSIRYHDTSISRRVFQQSQSALGT